VRQQRFESAERLELENLHSHQVHGIAGTVASQFLLDSGQYAPPPDKRKKASVVGQEVQHTAVEVIAATTWHVVVEHAVPTLIALRFPPFPRHPGW
jgi:hypothetical protein